MQTLAPVITARHRLAMGSRSAGKAVLPPWHLVDFARAPHRTYAAECGD